MKHSGKRWFDPPGRGQSRYMREELKEGFDLYRAAHGRFEACAWLCIQIVKIFVGMTFNMILWSLPMLKNYLTVALRILRKHKGYSLINVTGLVIGITCFLLIQIWIRYEMSYDGFHEKADRIYRIATDSKFNQSLIASASTPAIVAKTLLSDYPATQEATRVRRFPQMIVRREAQQFLEERVFAADSTFFSVFSFKLVKGDRRHALTAPNGVVITRRMAQKYFGDTDPMQQTLHLWDNAYHVTGVMEEMPVNSHFHADFIVSGSGFDYFTSDNWWSSYVRTYVVLQKGYPYKEFNRFLDELVFKYRNPGRINTKDTYWKWYLQPLTTIHLDSHLSGEFERNGSRTLVYLFSVISLIILLLACFNFINLSTARTAYRAKEISMRKVVGSSRRQLRNLFLGETALICTLSTGIAVLLIGFGLPMLNRYLGKALTFSLADPLTALSLVLFIATVSLLAGIYPATVLSALKPVALLKGGSKGSKDNPLLRNGLVFFQFAMTMILLIGLIVVQRQLGFLNDRELGFDKEQVVLVENAHYLGSRLHALQNALRLESGVIEVSAATTVPGQYFSDRGANYDGDKELLLYYGSADEHFLDVLNIPIKAGRYFSAERTADTSAMVINEAAVRALGWDEPLGKTITIKGLAEYRVIGVVKDLHFESKQEQIWPMALTHIGQKRAVPQYLVVKVSADHVSLTLARMEKVWKAIAQDLPYSYCFLDDDYQRLYRSEAEMAQLFSVFSGLALFLGGLGLLGLASFIIERRTKEVGVRKVVGAGQWQLLFVLMRQFIFWPLVAVVFACPVGWFLMHRWLQHFAYRIALKPDIFVLSGVAALGVAVLAVAVQSLKAVRRNPIEALRLE